MLAASDEQYERKAAYHLLMSKSRGRINDHFIACMLASLSCGESAMPKRLGLGAGDYKRMLNDRFGRDTLPYDERVGENLDEERMPELIELVKLMSMHRAGNDISEVWMTQIVAAGCMGGNHLWQDLGLWSRKDLSELMQSNFPALANKNDRDMKWKKFLYKQLCVQEGIYVCRSPSCEVCPDYADCFGPEE